MFIESSIQMPFLYPEGDGGAAPVSTPAAATPAAPAAPAAPATPSAPTPASATPSNAPTAATPQQPPVDGWVPSYRIRETREAAAREAQESFRAQQAELQAQVEQYRNQLQRLVGVNTPAQDPQSDAIKSQFAKLYPGLAAMEARAQDLMGVVDRAGDLENQTQHYWQTYGRQSMDRLFEHASKDLGAPLTEEGKRGLHNAFIGFVQSSPEMSARYAQDPSLVDEYWQAFKANFIDPVRRSTSAVVSGRAAAGAATPQDGGGIPVVSNVPKPKDLDERAALGWQTYQQNARK